MTTKAELSDLNDLLNEAARQLTEHFDSVRIFVTLTDQDKSGQFTRSCTTGYGNYWASLGYIEHWVNKKKEEARIEARETGDESQQELSDDYSDWSRG
jgi:hypothetical protein